MSNTITDNPFLSQLFDVKESNKNAKPGLDVSELAKAKHDADQFSRNVNSDDVSYKPSAKTAVARMEQFERAYQYSETMSLQLTTKEGDTVSVDFRQLYAQYQSYKETQAGEQGPQGVRYFESKEALEMTAFEEQFAFSVEGDLNEDELKAVFDVFEQVDALSNQFFDGNIEKALQQAMELEIDYGQLSSMKLNLTQTESVATRYQQAALAEYNDVQQQVAEPEDVAEEYGVDMNDLPPYLQSWQETITRLNEQFENAQSKFNELMGDVTAQRFPEQDSQQVWLERVKVFHEHLAEMAQMDKLESPVVSATEDSIEAMPNATSQNTEQVV
ncbi:MAG: hypothetical protein U9N57_10990 [Pseudomonadota bacterium]|nr:hypothetical protein [Pseudomonadota bacterium]